MSQEAITAVFRIVLTALLVAQLCLTLPKALRGGRWSMAAVVVNAFGLGFIVAEALAI